MADNKYNCFKILAQIMADNETHEQQPLQGERRQKKSSPLKKIAFYSAVALAVVAAFAALAMSANNTRNLSQTSYASLQ